LFEDWFANIVVPFVVNRRNETGYQGSCVLIIDECSSHHSSNIDEWCYQNMIQIVILSPHSSDQLQPLDL
jgi:hypothetical protein